MITKSIIFFYITLLLACDKNINSTLSVRNAHSLVYNTDNEKVYLFAGATEKEVLSDLWVFNDNNWEKVNSSIQPDPRTFAALSYDQANKRIIMFGGSRVLFGTETSDKNLLNDTWQFKENIWEKIITKNSPNPRAEASMVYDESRNRLVLFGGYMIKDKQYIKLGDTWEFYDNNWQLVSETGPSQRHGVAMVYHEEKNKTILFGGSTIDKQYGDAAGETWQWNGKNWEKLEIKQPTGVFNSEMVYDPFLNQCLRFGGWNGKSRINETWLFTNTEWKQLIIKDKPEPRNHSAMVYDLKRKSIILYGGHDGKNIFGDTWELKDYQWKRIIDNKTLKRINNGH